MNWTCLMIAFAMLVVGFVSWHLGGKERMPIFLRIIAPLIILVGIILLVVSLGRVAMIIAGAVAMMGGGAGLGISFSELPSASRSVCGIVSFLLIAVGIILCFMAG